MLIILLDFFSTLGIFRIDIPFLSRAIQQSESILEGCFAVRDDAALFSWLKINRYLMTAKSSLIDIGVVILVVWWLCHDKRIRVVYGVVLAVCIISFNYGLMARAESSRILLYQYREAMRINLENDPVPGYVDNVGTTTTKVVKKKPAHKKARTSSKNTKKN